MRTEVAKGRRSVDGNGTRTRGGEERRDRAMT